MSFRLVPNAVTLNDLERCNSPNDCVMSSNSVAFGLDYIKVVEDTPVPSAAECLPKNVVAAIYHVWQYRQGITPSKSVKVWHSSLTSEKWTITWKRCKIGGRLRYY